LQILIFFLFFFFSFFFFLFSFFFFIFSFFFYFFLFFLKKKKATRYGGWEVKTVDNSSLSDVEVLFPDIDRKGNMINIMTNAYCWFLVFFLSSEKLNHLFADQGF